MWKRTQLCGIGHNDGACAIWQAFNANVGTHPVGVPEPCQSQGCTAVPPNAIQHEHHDRQQQQRQEPHPDLLSKAMYPCMVQASRTTTHSRMLAALMLAYGRPCICKNARRTSNAKSSA